jgi:hypothetical protein
MFSLPKCQSEGRLVSDSSTTVSFDPTTGQASFVDFKITNTGMYLLMINVRTVGSNDYNFNCFSKPVIVKEPEQNIRLTATEETSTPNFYFKFDGNFDTLTPEKIEQYKSIFYNCVILKYKLTLSRELALYKGSIVADAYITGSSSSLTSLLNDLNANKGFSLETGVDLLYADIFSTNYVFRSQSNNNGNGDSGNQQEQQEQEKINQRNAVI